MNDTLKNLLLVAVSFLILMLVVFGSGWFLQAARAQSSGRTGQLDEAAIHSLTVSGKGQAQAQPDQAVIRLGVQTENREAAAALAENSQKMQGLVDALQEAGVDLADIKTQTVALYPVNRAGTGAAQPLDYRAVNTVQVLVRQSGDVTELLNAAVKAGGNTVEEVRYEVSDPSAAVDEARQAAMEAARREAEQLANLAEAELGEVLRIEEISQEPQVAIQSGGAGGPALMDAAGILPGTNLFEVTVNVTWLMVLDEAPNDDSQEEPGGTAAPQSFLPMFGE